MANTPDDKTLLSEGRVLGPYKLLKQIGAGGMGVVFQARDIERNTLVALKTLHKLDPLALLKLKNEFRSTANVLHPNLVTLHELMREDDVWFFTMEYVEGESLATLLKRAADTSRQDSPLVSMETVTSARSDAPLSSLEPETRTSLRSDAFADTLPSAQASKTHEETLTSISKPDSNALATGASPATEARGTLASEEFLAETRPLLELEKLRHVFSELALGICALHEAGKLHCDIKPGNVMVAEDGRVVLLDFGLVTERVQDKSRSDMVLAGTPAYMAPEQIAGEPASEASDWYALGVMLYEALCGRRPFGSASALREKLQRTAPPLPTSVHIPEDLRELCMALLSREPAARPSGPEVLKRLRGERAQATFSEPAQEVRALLGRQEHLAALNQAYQAVRTGSAVTLHVHGRSGMGKTALLQHFLGELRRQEGVVVLHGRCYERESVPYKAFDELVDSLTRYLQSLPSRQLHELLPENVAELARAFPVLRQLPGLSRMPEQLPGSQEQSDLRRRAFRALKELLARLAREVVLVLHIDDLQWGEQDSFALLNELITPPQAPSMLLLCSLRTEEAEALGLLAEHRRLRTVLADRVDIRELEIGPLSEADATQLAASLLGSPTDPRAPGIAREAHGNPFFVEELARYALTADTTAPATASPAEVVTLEQVILSRVSRLPERARDLLEVVAVAGRRIAQGVATRAAEVGTDVHVLWNMLRNGSLVQTRGPRDADPVECYHDRIRESVHASLPSDRLKAHHYKLAEFLEAAGDSEPEALARHYMNAGMRDKAGSYLTQAADRAAEALAFEQAAQLYALALECLPGVHELKVKRATALMNAGRCAESAPVFLDAAQGAPEDEQFGLRLRAAEQLLASGHIDDGEALLKPLFGQLRLPYPTSSKQAMVGLLGRSILLSLRGTRFRERSEAEVPPELLRAVDATWGVGQALSAIDYIRGGYFTMRSAYLALKAGEPQRVARSLAILGVVAVYRGRSADLVRGKRLIAEAEQIAQRLGDHRLLAVTRLSLATSSAMQSKWRQANELLQEGLRLLETKSTAVGWERSAARVSFLSALWYQGELNELALRSTTWLRYANEVGDLFGGIWMRIYGAPAVLTTDTPTEAERMLDEALALLDQHTKLFTSQHFTALLLKAETDLYRGEPARALERLEAMWKDASAFFSASFGHCIALHIRGTAMLTLAHENPAAREKLLVRVERDAAKLRRENPTFGRAPEALLRAGLAMAQGQREVALSQLDTAIEAYEKGEMMLRAACARRRKGELLGGEQGRALVEAADSAIRAQGIRDVERWTRMYNALPGATG